MIIIYFYFDETDFDVDNIAKPILNALIGLAYHDDEVVSQVLIRKSRIDRHVLAADSPEIVETALGGRRDFVYIKVADPPNHGVLA